jgi:ABC-2 type transport system permease protein
VRILLGIAGNELRRLFAQPFAWTLLAAMLALLAWLFLLSLDAFLALMPKIAGQDSAPGVTDLIAIPLLRALANLLLLIIPLLSMRLISGERRAGTLPLLLTAGIGEARIVIGKYIGALAYLAIVLLLALMLPLSLGVGTTLDLGKLFAATFGVGLFGAALLAIGLLASTWSEQPALAAALAYVISLLLWVLDAGARVEGINNSAINYLALPSHLDPMLRGIISTVDIVYFVLLIVVCLTLATRRLDSLRHNG